MTLMINANECPFCLLSNACTVNKASCWCQNEKVPTELIALLPHATVNKKCICLPCIERYQQDPLAFKEQFHGKT